MVALADDSAVALGHIRRTPAYIQMMHRYEQRLDVGPCSHFGSAAQQHTHLSAAYLGEKFCFLVLRICVVDELDLLFGHTGVEQLGANIIIDVERTVPLGSRHIAENQLGQLLLLGVVPDAQDVVDAGI